MVGKKFKHHIVLPINRKTIASNKVSTSITRSMITVPSSTSNGMFSFLLSVPQRVISPIRGNARLAK
jgi:hypothetical protein